MKPKRPTAILAATMLYLSSALHISLAIYHLMMPIEDRSEFGGLRTLSDVAFSILTILFCIGIGATAHQLGRSKNWPYLLNALLLILLMPVMAISGLPQVIWREFSLNKEILPVLVLGAVVLDFILKWKAQRKQII